MNQKNLIKISEFQIDDGDLLLTSEMDGLPFLAVDEKGIVFDDGPFTGFFCRLEGLSKFFVLKDESKDVFSLQLMFAEGDVYPMGKARFSVQYNAALCWVIAANKKIAQKKGDEKEYSRSFAKEVTGKIINCLEQDKDNLIFYLRIVEIVNFSNIVIEEIVNNPDPLIEKIVDVPDLFIEKIASPKDREYLIEMARERFSIFVPGDSTLPIRTIADAIRLVNAQVKDEEDLRTRPRRKIIDKLNKNQGSAP